jgi:hypothetical protein
VGIDPLDTLSSTDFAAVNHGESMTSSMQAVLLSNVHPAFAPGNTAEETA